MTSPASDRLQALRDYQILDTPEDPLADKVTALAAQLTGMPYAAITLVDADRQWVKSWYGTRPTRTRLNESICATLAEAPQFFMVQDASREADLRVHPAVACENGVRFYAAAPLVSDDGYSLGALCVYDIRPGRLTPFQCAGLTALAEIAMGLFAAHRRSVEFEEEKDHLRRIADNSPGGLFEFAMDGSGRQWISFASQGVCDVIGVSPEAAVDDFANVARFIHPDDLSGFVQSIDAVYRTRGRWEHVFRVNHPQRGMLSILGISHPMPSDSDVVVWQGCVMDVTQRMEEQRRIGNAQAQLEAQFAELQEYQMLVSQIGRLARIGAWSIELPGRKLSWTPDVYYMYDMEAGSPVDLSTMLRTCTETCRSELAAQIEAAIEFGAPIKLEFEMVSELGTHRWLRTIGELQSDADGIPTRLLGSVQDISRERHLLERVRHHASHDHLTGLANRNRFFNLMTECLATGAVSAWHALAFIDLDHFKDVNDALGYDAGDRLISTIGTRLKAIALRDGRNWVAGRFGGDEFALLVRDVPKGIAASELLAMVIQELLEDVDLGSSHVSPTISVGIATYPFDGRDGATLFRRADLALRHAKQGGRARTVRFDPSMEAESAANRTLRREVMEGLKQGQFELHFQPIMDLRQGHLHGFEALMRWHHPTRGLVPAVNFAHLIDDPLIGQKLSDTAIDQVTATMLDWNARDIPYSQIALNISSSQLRSPTFQEQICRIPASGIEPSRIKLEITESVLLGRTATKAAQVLAGLNEMGFEIALDDFGTGYASLVHLTQFPISQIKIDMSFVRNMRTSRQDRTIVQTMCALAQGLDITAVAEGVEDEAVERLLRLSGCTFAQGYLYEKAMPAATAADFALRNRAPQADRQTRSA